MVGTWLASGSILTAWLVCLDAAASARPPDGKTDYTQGCTVSACHGALTGKRKTHGALVEGSCDACHEAVAGERHAFTFTEEDGELCLQCHDEFEGVNIHAPVRSGTCTSCHDPHGSDHDDLLLTATVGASCATCHEKTMAPLKLLHGPVAAGVCTSCHDPHASDHSNLLLTEGNALCVTCHKPIEDRIAGAVQVHHPVTESCLTCHDPHGGSDQFNLTESMPDLCMECHEDVADTVADAQVAHDAVTEGRACSYCHDPHAAMHKPMLRDEPMTLCLSCHDEPLASNGGTIGNVAKIIADNPNHHGPIGDGDCTSCHAPHGSANFRLLVEAYPAKFYAPFDEEAYQLCFSCHESDLALEPETDELTGFRNGTRNLHYLHVNRKLKGRTCRACHNVHASRRASLVAESVTFGTWELPINYRSTETGGSCQPGCHKPYRYDREHPIVNLPPMPVANADAPD